MLPSGESGENGAALVISSKEKRDLARKISRASVDLDEFTAEDYVEDVHVALLQHPERAGRIQNIESYFFAAARNRAANDATRSPWKKDISVMPPEDLDARPFPRPGECGLTTTNREFARWVVTAIERLPDRERLAVRLRLIEGIAPKELAARLGLKKTTAYKELNQGLDRLRRWARTHPEFREWVESIERRVWAHKSATPRGSSAASRASQNVAPARDGEEELS
jgi:RNA polymerase sigma factor (sigma-70 family)